MADIYHVNTREELKQAIENGAQCISITDQEVAKHTLNVKAASKATIVAALVGAGVATAMWWNPLGWLAGTVAASTAAAVAYLVFKLGLDSFWGLYGNYEIIGRRIAKLKDNAVVEGELILKKRET